MTLEPVIIPFVPGPKGLKIYELRTSHPMTDGYLVASLLEEWCLALYLFNY